MMKLKTLLENLSEYHVNGSQEILITGLSANSKLISPGNLFIAKKGKTFDGRDYIPEAVKLGASAIVTECYNLNFKDVVQVIHPNIASFEASLAANYYHNPSQELLMIGITGTNGKTTTSYYVKYFLDHFLSSCGLIGGIKNIIGKQGYAATHTTPDVVTNHRLLREMITQGCQAAVMEVTSHALDQGRVEKIDFDVAVFSNLTHEHLDYHHTLENYAAAKQRLFQHLGREVTKKRNTKWAVVNNDSPWSSLMLKGCATNVFTYGIEHASDLRATDVHFNETGMQSQLTYQGQTIYCHFPFIGQFNVYNCLAAMAICLTQGISFDALANRIIHLPSVPGRLQPIKNKKGLKIYVDHAHKPDALNHVLQTLKGTIAIQGRLIVVFGCGGDRDKTKRPKMAEACQAFADFSIVTSDNPRSENPMKICDEIIKGFTKPEIYHVEIDRKSAIKLAIQSASSDDIILIAGKGHEAYQIFNHQMIEFDDYQVAEAICDQIM